MWFHILLLIFISLFLTTSFLYSSTTHNSFLIFKLLWPQGLSFKEHYSASFTSSSVPLFLLHSGESSGAQVLGGAAEGTGIV